MKPNDWIAGGQDLVLQRCPACSHAWYFSRRFCPQCGRPDPTDLVAQGTGTVHATTVQHRAPDDSFRALAPYRIVLVDLDEGVRVMGHGAAPLAIGDRVRFEARTLAGRTLPFFDLITSPAP